MSAPRIAEDCSGARSVPARLRNIPNLMSAPELPVNVVRHPGAQVVPVLQRLGPGPKDGVRSLWVYRQRRGDVFSRSQLRQELREQIERKASMLGDFERFAPMLRYELAVLHQQLQALDVVAAAPPRGVAHGP